MALMASSWWWPGVRGARVVTCWAARRVDRVADRCGCLGATERAGACAPSWTHAALHRAAQLQNMAFWTWQLSLAHRSRTDRKLLISSTIHLEVEHTCNACCCKVHVRLNPPQPVRKVMKAATSVPCSLSPFVTRGATASSTPLVHSIASVRVWRAGYGQKRVHSKHDAVTSGPQSQASIIQWSKR